ncbi:alanine racemase, partial [Micrococcus luteus]|nr:alanine racemase [Micrococcus luteus]
ADYVSEFHALDSLRLAARVNRFMAEAGRVLPVYVQVNTSLEQSKYGLPVAETLDFIDECAAFSHLRVVGLMTLAMNSKNEEEV